MSQDQDTHNQEDEVIPTVGEPKEFEYRTVRDGRGRVYTIKMPIVEEYEYPKKHRMTKKRGPGRPPKNKPVE